MKKNYCIDCGKEIKNIYAKRCYPCFNEHRKHALPIICCDCGKILNTRNKNTERCEACYKNLIKVEDRFCIDCGKKLHKYKKSLRCYSCNNKYLWKIGKRKPPSLKFESILTKEYCIEQYINQKKSGTDICNKIGCTKGTLYKYLRKYDISIRSNSEAHIGRRFSKDVIEKRRELFKGKNNPNWNGGLDKDGYSFLFNNELKKEIRERDNFVCQNCGMTEEEHFIVRGTNLHVHHINYNKQNCEMENLITVCSWCNIRANFNRDYWYAYYRYTIDNRLYKEKTK